MTRSLSAIATACLTPIFIFVGGFALADRAHATTLYAGVSHTEAMMHVDEVKKNATNPTKAKTYHGALQQPAPPSKPLTGNLAAETTKPAHPTPPTKLTASVQQAAPKPPVSNLVADVARAAAAMPKQGYLPAFGVAHAPEHSADHRVITVGAQKFSVQWFMIPSWMSGRWDKDGDLTTQVTNLATGRTTYPNIWIDNKLVASWGHQKDRAGNIWHVNLLPAERDGLSDGKQVRFLTVAQRCEQTNQAQLVTRTHYLVSESDIMNGASEGSFQQESLNDYVFEPQTQLLINHSSNRVFSYSGAPVRDGVLLSKYRKLTNFTPTPTMMGLDLRQSLQEFLMSEGLSNLVDK